MEPGGTILFYSQCGEGVGSESLSRALAGSKDKFFDTAYNDYDLNNQTAISLLTLTERYHVVMVTELDDETLEGAGITRCSNAEASLAEALDIYSVDRIAVMPYGAQTLPFVKKG
jgi:nickel-dependent lactate racemase